MKKLKLAIYNTIRTDDDNDLKSNIVDGIILALIILNVFMVILDTFKGLPQIMREVIRWTEVISVAIFTVEYILRVWTSDFIRLDMQPWVARLRYCVSLMALIDLLAILPFYLPFLIPIDLRVLRMVRLLRLLRILKVNRYTDALASVGRVLKNKASQLLSSLFVVGVLIIIASVLMYNIESEAQPELFDNAFSGMWWAVATLTTVGYGDVYPITALGKILSAFIALMGIGLVAVPTGIISAGFVEQITSDDDVQKNERHYCPHCGKKLD